MILIIANKEKNTSLYIPVEKLRFIRVYKDDSSHWIEKGDRKEEWGICFDIESEYDNELSIVVGDENATRELCNQIPLYINQHIYSSKVLLINI